MTYIIMTSLGAPGPSKAPEGSRLLCQALEAIIEPVLQIFLLSHKLPPSDIKKHLTSLPLNNVLMINALFSLFNVMLITIYLFLSFLYPTSCISKSFFVVLPGMRINRKMPEDQI